MSLILFPLTPPASKLVSLADTFLCATAKSRSATIVTKDSEIEAAVKLEGLAVLWIKGLCLNNISLAESDKGTGKHQ